jgi:two-component system, chemotaxis family, chemotaxis protein CheY
VSRTILLVGHCGPDSWALKTAISRIVPGSSVELVNDERSLQASLPQADLLLVNRILDGDFGMGQGATLISRLLQTGILARFMLISNYPEAQQEAVAAGAMPGFGKSEMYSAKATELIRAALGESTTAD